MDLAAKTETDLVVLRRIVAMLFALAHLAERAHSLPYPVRCLVLWALRPAEATARAFVAAPLDSVDDFRAMMAAGGEFSDALALAVSFRMLAHMLEAMMVDELWLSNWSQKNDAGRFMRRLALAGHERIGDFRRLLAIAGFAPIPRLDTS